MERKSNITIWQLHLFEGLDRDIMVMHRDEEEVFDDAIHVFFDKQYYDAYISKATKYSNHKYSYHDDKLGDIIYQIFDENIPGMVLHMSTQDKMPGNVLCEEKYLSAKDLVPIKETVENYHYLYLASIQRMDKNETIAKLWTRNVFIIGQLPDFRVKENQRVELMTLRRKKDGTPATDKDYDYESLKIFLTADSAMRFNPDKRPVNRYKLSMLANFVKGRLQIIIEPHRNYWLEFDPAEYNVTDYRKAPEWNEDKVKERIRSYTDMEEVYILLASKRSDYRACMGLPFFVKLNEQNLNMYLFQNYEDAVKYVVENSVVLPIYDGVYPIGVLKKSAPLTNLRTVLAIAAGLGVTGINLDMETENAIGTKMSFFAETAGLEMDVAKILSDEDAAKLKLTSADNSKTQYRFEPIPFYDSANPYSVSEERKKELISYIDNGADKGATFTAGCTVPEMIFILGEIGKKYEAARKAEDEEKKKLYNRLMNIMTVPITEALCEKSFIFTLRNDDGSFSLRNNIAYLIITNRFEAGRNGEGKLVPASLDNDKFMESLEQASKVAALTDGPDGVCLMDVHLMREIIAQMKKAEPLKEEMLIYMTQGYGLSYTEACYNYKRLRTDYSIFVEFASRVRNGEYPPMGLKEVAGYTAKRLEEEKGLNPLEAYNALITLKENPKAEIAAGKSSAASADAQNTSEDITDTNSDKNTSFFGKLFKNKK